MANLTFIHWKMLKNAVRIVVLVNLICSSPAFSENSVNVSTNFGFEVTGTMEVFKDSTPTSVSRESCQFKAVSKGSLWLVTTIKTNGQTIYQGCNGLDAYWLMDDKSTPELAAANFAHGRVTEGRYPLHSAGVFETLPWLAFCSSDYLTENLSSGVSVCLLYTSPSPR